MKLCEFALTDPTLFRFREDTIQPTTGWVADEELELLKTTDGLYLAKQGDALTTLVPVDRRGEVDLLLTQRTVFWILRNDPSGGKGAFELQLVRPLESREVDELEICIDDKVAEFLARRNEIPNADAGQAVDWCRDEFLSDSGGIPRLFVARHGNDATGTYQLIGRRYRADTAIDAAGKLLVRRLAPVPSPAPDFVVLTGSIAFVDYSVAIRLLGAAQQAALEQATASNRGYLDLWRRYAEKEWEVCVNDAAKIGSIRFHGTRERDDGPGYVFKTDPAQLQEFRQRWNGVATSDDTQLAVDDEAPTWDPADPNSYASIGYRGGGFAGSVVRFLDDGIEIKSNYDTAPPERGYLFVSLSGERKMQKRREEAYLGIESRARLPQLRWLLEELPVDVASHQRFTPVITPAVRRIFREEPTQRQRDAIDVALHTPDIALIIGPPGTGKTQVIAAIERRLAEDSSATRDHRVLICSIQHDAVDNALERTQAFGLPPLRVGGKENARNEGGDAVIQWCDHKQKVVSQHIEEREKSEPDAPLLRQVTEAIAQLRFGHLTAASRLQMFEELETNLQALADRGVRLPTPVVVELETYLAYARTRTAAARPEHRSHLQPLIRALRTTTEGFLDDGPARARRLTDALAGDVSAARYHPRLAEFTDWDGVSPATDFLERAARLRAELLEWSLPDYRPPAVRTRLDDEGDRVLAEIEAALSSHLARSRRGITGVLTNFRDALLHSPRRAHDSAAAYAHVVGATCQQALHRDMATVQDVSRADVASISFDTVIIDEAARANPLDLFVPMSLATRRIVLVGDHRQLPHLLQADIEEEVSEDLNLEEAQRRAYKESLFERLWRQLSQRQLEGDARRVVMLDTQFRMHPVLGDFVSRQFYERHGLDRIESGRKPESFASDIPGYENKVCAWINVPGHDDSRRERRNKVRSLYRDTEAKVVAEEAARLLHQCDRALSLGIISFYRAQVDAIYRELAKRDIAEPDGKGGYRLLSEYRHTPDGGERLRIGTVDAFQGKEFDIVILSAVRSNNQPRPRTGAADAERAANTCYGHLRLSNRLNVAMSRQRSLLITVGDLDFMCEPSAREYLPEIQAFIELCRSEHGSVR